MEYRCFDGRVVLVVEDEPLVGLDVRDLLGDHGATVLLARNVKDALPLTDSPELAAAILDINLGEEDCSAICQRLSERGVPFIFHTGYSSAAVFERWSLAPVLSKPSSGVCIIEALTRLDGSLHSSRVQAAVEFRGTRQLSQ